MRLIDADKIEYQYGGLVHIDPSDYIGTAKCFKRQIDAQPTVDARIIIHARWEYHLMPVALKCSYCKNRIAWKRKIDYNYCPFCGAKMDGD